MVDCDDGRRSGCRTFCCHLLVRLGADEDPPGGRRDPLQSMVDKDPATGACVHLERDGLCGVWEERPRACREYDCREDPRLELVLREGFVSVTRLARGHADRVREPQPGAVRVRAREVEDLRRRLAQLPGPQDCTPVERAQALRARDGRIALARLTGTPRACGTCVVSDELPAGGRCCMPDVDALFDETQLAILRAGGTEPGDLPIRAVRAVGCPFCSSRGCVLPPTHRPSPCAAYACEELRAEAGPKLAAHMDAVVEDLTDATAIFTAVRSLRGLAELLDDVLD